MTTTTTPAWRVDYATREGARRHVTLAAWTHQEAKGVAAYTDPDMDRTTAKARKVSYAPDQVQVLDDAGQPVTVQAPKPRRTYRVPTDGSAGVGAVRQVGGGLPIYRCTLCDGQVVWAESKRTGRKYLANVSHGYMGQAFYVGANIHDCLRVLTDPRNAYYWIRLAMDIVPDGEWTKELAEGLDRIHDHLRTWDDAHPMAVSR
jgi:hypothetical protein